MQEVRGSSPRISTKYICMSETIDTQLTPEMLQTEKEVVAARFNIDPDNISRINYYGTADSLSRIVTTVVVELKTSE